MRCAALNTGPEFHGLDHIAPLAERIGMPLLVTEELNHQLALRYYPQVETRWLPDLEFKLAEIAQEFDTLFECKYWNPNLKSIFKNLYQKEMQLVFCPHGQSDKGFQAPLLAPFATQESVLLYGPLLIQMLKELQIWPAISKYGLLGNYRLSFYQKYRPFYDALIAKEIPLDRKKKTVVYAPTWRDADQASSFFHYGAKLFKELPSDWNLIFKVHPLLEQRNPAPYYSLLGLAEKKPNLFIVHECPLVYPILSCADVYLGDSSSVGYDFLYFQKPLYFFPTSYRGRLFSCGTQIDPERDIYAQLEAPNRYVEEQKKLYALSYGAPWDLSQIFD